jgi:hypothetical protein
MIWALALDCQPQEGSGIGLPTPEGSDIGLSTQEGSGIGLPTPEGSGIGLSTLVEGSNKNNNAFT